MIIKQWNAAAVERGKIGKLRREIDPDSNGSVSRRSAFAGHLERIGNCLTRKSIYDIRDEISHAHEVIYLKVVISYHGRNPMGNRSLG